MSTNQNKTMQLELTTWIEDLISTRDSYRAEAEATGRENMRIKEQLAKDFAEIAEQLAAKDAEIARTERRLKRAVWDKARFKEAARKLNLHGQPPEFWDSIHEKIGPCPILTEAEVTTQIAAQQGEGEE